MTDAEKKAAYESWRKERAASLQTAENALPTGLRKFIGGDRDDPFYEKLWAHLNKGGKLSDFVKKNMKELFGKYIREDLKDSFLWSVDNFSSWQYSTSSWRRSYRSSDERAYIGKLTSLIVSYKYLSYYTAAPLDIITGELDGFELAHRNSGYWSSTPYEYLLAYELDRGNQRALKAVEDIIMGEGTTLHTELICGVLMSKNAAAHKLLGKLLLAARLQEGVRQAVCENADCGTAEGFMHILGVVNDNDLIRFSSVKRAAATWCGLFAENIDGFERIAKKTVKLMHECLTDEKAREACLSGEDAMEIYIALWAYSFVDAVEGIKVCRRLVKNGTKHQRMVCGVFVHSFDSPAFENECGKFAIENFSGERETAALFIDSLMSSVGTDVFDVMKKMIPDWGNDKPSGKRIHTEFERFFDSREEAYKFYAILKELYASIPKKEIKFEKCVFPWHTAVLSKSSVIIRMAYIASALADNDLIDEVCPLIGELEWSRYHVLVLLTAYPETEIQQSTAVAGVANRDSSTAKTAYKIIKESVKLTEENYLQLEQMLKYKSADIRKNVIDLLLGQEDKALQCCCERLLSDKSSEKRTGGLDIVMQIKKAKNRAELFEGIKPAVEGMSRDVSKEKILIDEILGGGASEPQEGYGLYSPSEEEALPDIDAAFIAECRGLFGRVFPEGCFGSGKKQKGEPDYAAALKKLDALIDEHANDEFTDRWGEKTLLGNARFLRTPDNKMPFAELWKEFYDKEICSPELLLRMIVNMNAFNDLTTCKVFKGSSDKMAARLFGKEITVRTPLKYPSLVKSILSELYYGDSDEQRKQEKDTRLRLSAAVCEWLLGLPEKEFLINFTGDGTERRSYSSDKDLKCRRLLYYHPQIGYIADWLGWQENDDNFIKIFPVMCALEKKANYSTYDHYYDESPTVYLKVGVNDSIRACALGLISDSTLYKLIFEGRFSQGYGYRSGLSDALDTLSNDIKFIRERDKIVAGSRGWYNRAGIVGSSLVGNAKADGERELDDNDRKVLDKAREVYENVIGVILETELKRGDSETVFSASIRGVKRIYGADNFVRILAAMGKDTFDRSGYYYGSASKRESLSHLINVCVPDDGDSAETLRGLVKSTDITEKRLIEAAMYSPEWIDIVEEYLGWEGFRSGCYYFMAHMNESFDAKREAMIAKFSPLSPEELQQGAFDIGWFREAHSMLGEKRFATLYDAAKYISDGGKHSRARKYADAVMGKLDEGECEAAISDKRNKDLLMAYSLIPIGGDEDVMRRYLFLQKFLKESKQFGAQRRASEAAAVDIGMRNLATAAGLSDVTRLKLRMETRFFESIREQFEPREIGEVKVWLEVTDGKAELKCEKGGKLLKSVPAKLKKDAYIVGLTETKKQLTEQYRRTRLMLEQAMEDGGVFTLGEINMLKTNPVAAALTENLVYNANGKCLLIRDGALVNADGEVISTDESAEIKIAHPLDMYRDGSWRAYQKYLFERQLVQPFRQVFRELYLKTDDELEAFDTRRYAGNQIQVKQTIACLKTRRWVCDVEDGLQKVYFGENLVAKLFALADWFSPSDIEAPTLEWVGFTDRKTGAPVRIKDVPDLIFSEVMRDVDLAVSVCHAGEVDPEHSHSTIEMRAAILEFTLPLFKLDNCEVSGSHVLIKGSRAEYSVHLGSGVCHIRGGAMINILPVHSQHRGRIFLPFADEDPKTAEVISKVLLLAEDKKIKDPYILSQIGG